MRRPLVPVLLLVLALVVWGFFRVAGSLQACNDKGGVMTSDGQCVVVR